MKKAILVLALMIAGASANANAAVFFGQPVTDGYNFNCVVPGPAYGIATVAAIQFNYSCMDNGGFVFNYNPIIPYNNISSDVYAGTAKTFFGVPLYNCRVVASSCVVRTL